MKKLPWMISTGACAVSGFLVAAATHQNIPNEISTKDPGKIQVEFSQPAPAFGKFASLGFAAGTGLSLWMFLRPDDEEVEPEIAKPVRGNASRTTTVKSVAQQRQAPVYDADEEFDEEELNEPIQGKPEKSEVVIDDDAPFFHKMFYHLRRHILVPCATGSGKTTMLLGAIVWAFQHFGEDGVEFFISTTKKGNFLGLEDMKAGDKKPYVLFIDPEDPETILPLYNRLRYLRKRLVARGEKRMEAELAGREIRHVRNVICLDEWNETLDVAKRYDTLINRSLTKKDMEEGAEKSFVYDDLIDLANSFIRMGREDEVVAWFFAQDHQVQNAKINTGYIKSVATLVPFRKAGGMESIEDIFVGQRPLAAKGMGQKLLQQANDLVESSDSTFAYSTLDGHEFLEMPYLPDVKRKRLFTEKAKTNVVAFAKPEFPKAVGDVSDPWED